jgi:hypothetical protein
MRILFFLLVAACVGCTHVADRYSMSSDNVAAIRSLDGGTFKVGSFVASPGVAGNSIQCAGVSIAPPDGISFSEYVRSALIAELKMANAYSPTAPTTIVGSIDSLEVDASAFPLTGQWRIVLKTR